MWSAPGGWGHYPIQQSAYANIPTEEVDWASLAKQWIAQREVMTSAAIHEGPPSVQYVSTHVPPPPPPPPPAPALDHQQQLSVNTSESSLMLDGCTVRSQSSENIIADSCNSQDSTDSGMINQVLPAQQPRWDSWSNASWSMPSWAVPPPPPPDQNDGLCEGQFPAAESFMPAYEYNQNMNEFYEQPLNNDGAGGFPYWPMSSDHQHIPQMMPRSSACEFRPAPRRGFVGATANVPSLLDDTLLDASKRRQLPAWIREGLEKMEREKQKQMEREKTVRDSQTAKELHKADGDVDNDSKQSGPLLPAKSRFDSDNEDNSDTETRGDIVVPPSDLKKQKRDSPERGQNVNLLTDEEKQMQIMMRVRQMLTEVLLDVTNREIADIAHSVYKSAKAKQAKAPAKQLVKSSALASITSLGLGYDSESDDDDSRQGNSTPTVDVSESSDEDTVQQRILDKKTAFEQKMRQLEERENEKASLRSTLLHKSKLENFSTKQENVCDVQSTVKSGIDLGKCLQEDSKERKLVTPCHIKPDPDRSLLAGDEGDYKLKRPKTEVKERGYGNSEPEAISHSMDHTNYKLRQECSKMKNSSDGESYGQTDESHNVKVMGWMKNKAAREDSTDTKNKHSKRHSEEFVKKTDSNKLRYEERYDCGNSELTDDRLGEQRSSTSPESHGRRRSSRSRDRDNRKLKKKRHESHKRKRTHDAEFDERLERDIDSSSRHKKRHRSCSGSGSSDSHGRSHRHHRSDDRRHRRQSSSRSREEHGRDSYGKKSHAKRKSRSLSRSSDDS